MAEVIVNVKANTGQATQGVDELNKSLNQTEVSAEQLEATLRKQEATVKVLDGAINVLGGSVELLASGLAVSGAVSEESARKFEGYTLAAIAFADGSKRVIDGFKNLNEGLKVYGGVTQLARKAQLAFNSAILANPYVAAGVALAAVTSAVLLWVNASKDEEEQNKDTTESINERIDAIKKAGVAYSNAQQKLTGLQASAAAANKTVQESIDLEKKRIQDSIKSRTDEINLVEQGRERAKRAGEEQLELFEAQQEERKLRLQRDKEALTLLLEAEQLYTTGTQTENQKRVENEKKTAKEIADAREKEVEDFFDFYLTMIKLGAQKRREALAGFQKDLANDNLKTFDATNKAFEARMKASTKMISTTGQQAQKSTVEVASANLFAYSELAENTLGGTVETFGKLFTTLADVTGEGNEEAFEKGKKYKIAEVVTSSIQAAFQAFGAAQQFGPILGPILGAAQVAAIAIASNKAIGDIKSSTFNSTSAPGGGTPSVSVPNVNTGPQGMGQFLPFTAPQQTPPVRAYVVTGDVTNGQVAEAQLQTRRRFG